MIDQKKHEAILLLHQAGMSIKQIAHRLTMSRNSVRAIIKEPNTATMARKDKIDLDAELIRELYIECSGRIERMHEKLGEEKGINIGYSTLTRIVRELGLGRQKTQRCQRVADQPGAEMQHDMTVYRLEIGGGQIRLVASLLYLRYCKMRYLKFYRFFNRFKMQCFLDEALRHWGYCARTCIIDNTNLARLSGTGKNALIVPEMEQFSRRYGFEFICHEIGHSNRKAGNERSFWTVETNFLPGRTFSSLEDLNQQALEWSTIRMANRPVAKSGLIPAKAFEHEQLYLIKMVNATTPPYRAHSRATDQYGYAAFAGNYYWVPGSSRAQVTVLEYAECLKIYQKRELLAEYKLAPAGVKNQLISPEGMPTPAYKPKDRKRPTEQEEKKLRAMAEEVDGYLNFVLPVKGLSKHRFLRQLFSLSQKVAPAIFIATLKRAMKYRISDIETIERICLLYLSSDAKEIPYVNWSQDLESREAYQQGCLSDSVDLSVYDWWEQED